TFSEAVTGFSNADLTVANGSLTDVSSSDGGVTWTATLTPDAPVSEEKNAIALPTGREFVLGVKADRDATDSNNYAVDTVRPTVSIVVDDTSLLSLHDALPIFTFSEAVTGFSNADLTVANGSLTDVSSSDGGVTWTATLTPDAPV